MHLELTPAQAAVAAEVEAFARDVVAPAAAASTRRGAFPLALVRQAGLARLSGHARSGCRRAAAASTTSTYALGIEAIARASATMAVILAVHNSLVCDTLACAGSAAQRSAWLPRLVTGEVIGAFALSEADAGTDAANQQTSATRRTPDGYMLTGRKVWVANGEVAGVAIVFAATTPGARGRGVSAFVVPLDRPGIRKAAGRGLARRAGPRVRGTGASTRSPSREDERIGEENQGFAVAQACARGRPHRDCGTGARRGPGGARRGAQTRAERATRLAVPSRSTRRFSGSSPTWRPNSPRPEC